MTKEKMTGREAAEWLAVSEENEEYRVQLAIIDRMGRDAKFCDDVSKEYRQIKYLYTL